MFKLKEFKPVSKVIIDISVKNTFSYKVEAFNTVFIVHGSVTKTGAIRVEVEKNDSFIHAYGMKGFSCIRELKDTVRSTIREAIDTGAWVVDAPDGKKVVCKKYHKYL